MGVGGAGPVEQLPGDRASSALQVAKSKQNGCTASRRGVDSFVPLVRLMDLVL